MKENIKIYLAWGPSGEYDTYYEECLGAFLKRENAEKAGKEWYDKKTNSFKDLPMTYHDPRITEVEIMDFHELKDLINNDKENN